MVAPLSGTQSVNVVGRRVVLDEGAARYSLSGGVLTVHNVCRDCADNTTDLQVFQCNVTNKHGSIFTAGYLNVLRTILRSFISCYILAHNSSFSTNLLTIDLHRYMHGGPKIFSD